MVQLVAELARLGGEGVGGGAGHVQLALRGHQLGAVPQGRDRPDVPPPGGHRHPAEGQDALTEQDDLVLALGPAAEDLVEAPVDPEVLQGPADAAGGQVEQAHGLVVDQRDPEPGVEADHPRPGRGRSPDDPDHNEHNTLAFESGTGGKAVPTIPPKGSQRQERTATMRSRAWIRGLLVAMAVGLVATACGESGGGGGGGGGNRQITGLNILVGTAPGGGFDQTARTAAKAMEDAKLARNVEVQNLPGAGNTIALQRLVNEKGNGKVMQQMGLGLVGGVYTNKSKATLDQTTPVARLTEEPEIVIVNKDSPYQSFDQLLSAWKADPGKLAVGGGSAPGGPDHLAPMLIAKTAGIDPKEVNFVSYDGGGELLAAVLGGQVAFGVTGPGETKDQIDAGEVRALAVTSAERAPNLDTPTLKEQGVDLEFTNWRGWVAPPELSEEDKQTLIDLATNMHDSQEWKDALAQNGWTDAFMVGDEYAAFIKAENQRVGEVLGELGLT
jgi:putative tricarboxylic transport membrane protein